MDLNSINLINPGKVLIYPYVQHASPHLPHSTSFMDEPLRIQASFRPRLNLAGGPRAKHEQ